MVFIPVKWVPVIVCIGGLAALCGGQGIERFFGLITAFGGGLWALAWFGETDTPSQ